MLPSKVDALHIKQSRVSPWRAVVLIGVNVLMAAHIYQWWSSSTHRTVSPVEPSESMATLELGQVNAGFVFFALALLSTFIFGRFFCGWGCHIVSLQDLCSLVMNKCGVKPKPFRSRVLLWGPFLLALYMFVWPTFKRLAIAPLDKAMHWGLPAWLIELPDQPHPGFAPHFIVTEFWKTFPPAYVAVPFLLVCGFAAVYFLGSKGFCTYGCPYGGFFAPLDRFSIGRIVVSDACEGCGHCTAVCTSNVRVHQEVRDFGMVVDPGCMKCMDCVSVCPKDALSFSFAAPAAMTKPRTPEAQAGYIQRPKFDLTLVQDFALFALALVLFLGFRGMVGKVPLLMAGGLAAVGAFFAWKLWSLVAIPNVRLQNLQLKLHARLRPAGFIVGLVCGGYIMMGLWSLSVRAAAAYGSVLDDHVLVPTSVVFSKDYRPQEHDKSTAQRAIHWLELAGAPSEGGFGWERPIATNIRLAWLYAVAGDLKTAEARLRQAIDKDAHPSSLEIFNLAQLMLLQGNSPEQVRALFELTLATHPELQAIRLALAADALEAGRPAKAISEVESVIAIMPPVEPALLAQAGSILLEANQVDRASEVLAWATETYPKTPLLHAEYSRALWFQDKKERAIAEIRIASELEPENASYLHGLAEMLGGTGHPQEAATVEQRARDLDQAVAPPR